MKAKAISLFSCLSYVLLLIVVAPSSEGAEPQLVNYPDCPCAIRDSLIVDEIRMPAPQEYVDYDGDGALDLVRKEVNGKVYVYINKGTNERRVYREGILYKGEEIKFETPEPQPLKPSLKTYEWVTLVYDRFDVYVEESYYYNNPGIVDFFNEFEERHAVLETWTDWSAEEYYDGQKLTIYVFGGPGCYGGNGGSGYVTLYLSDPLYMSGCDWAYYENGIPYFGNPGELGDWWRYMGMAMHEVTHAINPKAILERRRLTEAWAVYHEYNILSMYYGNGYPDINQETADHYIHNGNSYYNWEGYVANDYHDTSPDNDEIQLSSGYHIGAWMFSMLRDDYSLPWGTFYDIMDNNKETMDKSLELCEESDSIYIDTHVIDLFERAIGTPMYPVFRYDGPSGPGWGVREWESLDWYADLTPSLQLSDTIQVPEASISLDAVVYNNGNVSLNDVPVRFYSNDSLVNEQTADVDSDSFAVVSTEYAASEGTYEIRVVVDEDDIKIETDDLNNQDSATVSFTAIRGDANGDDIIDVGDVVYLVSYLYKNGPAPDPLDAGDANCDAIVNVGDIVYLVSYLYKGGPPPGCP